MTVGVLLSGPPASGKDTVTQALHDLAPSFVLFERLKVGSGRTDGYRMASESQLAALEAAGSVIQKHSRYGNTYVVDRPHLNALIAEGKKPVIHVGRLENMGAFEMSGYRFLSVLLWAALPVSIHRLNKRGSADVEARVRAWREERDDLGRVGDPPPFDLAIDTGEVSAHTAALTIARCFEDPDADRQSVTRVLEHIRQAPV